MEQKQPKNKEGNYLIGQKNVGQNWRNSLEVTKFMSDENYWIGKNKQYIFILAYIFILQKGFSTFSYIGWAFLTASVIVAESKF